MNTEELNKPKVGRHYAIQGVGIQGTFGLFSEACVAQSLTVQIHVPGTIAILALPDGLPDRAYQGDSQQTAKKGQDLEVGDALHIRQL